MLRSGVVEAADEGSVTFADEAAHAAGQLREPGVAVPHRDGLDALEPGDTVLLRTVDGVPAALLRVAGGGVDAATSLEAAAPTASATAAASATPAGATP